MTPSLAQPFDRAALAAMAPPRTSFAERLAALVPALVLLNPILIWPLLYATPIGGGHGLNFGFGASQSYLIHKIWMPPLFGLMVVMAFTAGRRHLQLNMAYIIGFAAFFAWSALSILWALAPAVAASRLALQIMIALSIYLSFALVKDSRKILEPVFWVIVVTVFANVGSVIMRPPGPIGHEGIFEHKNNLGAFCVVAIMFALYRLSWGNTFGKLVALMMLPICVALIAVSLSKTSAGLLPVCVFAGFAGAAVARWLRVSAALQFFGILVLMTVGVFLAESMLNLDFWDLSEIVTGDATFTGRTDIWAFTLDQVMQRPIGGYGFRSFWQIGAESPPLKTGATFIAQTAHAHNGYIDIMLHGGLVALFLFLPLLVVGLHLAGRIADRSFLAGSACLTLMVFSILYNLLETSWFLGTNVAFIIFHIAWLAIIYDPINVRSGHGEAPLWRM